MFYIKGSNTNDRVQKHSGRLKTEFEIQYDNHDDDTKRAPHPAHRCDANLFDLHGEDGAHSTVQPGGSCKDRWTKRGVNWAFFKF